MTKDELNDLEAEKIRLEIESLKYQVASDKRVSDKVLASAENNGQFAYVGVVHEAEVHRSMKELENFSKRNPGAPIEILLNSEGGNVIDGLAYVDFIRLLRKRGHRVTIIGYGIVASMAGAILACADDRVMTSRCWLGLHEVSSVVAGSITQQEDKVKFATQLQEQIVDLLCERSELTPAKLKARWRRKDLYINAKEALSLGFIDRIEDV